MLQTLGWVEGEGEGDGAVGNGFTAIHANKDATLTLITRLGQACNCGLGGSGFWASGFELAVILSMGAIKVGSMYKKCKAWYAKHPTFLQNFNRLACTYVPEKSY